MFPFKIKRIEVVQYRNPGALHLGTRMIVSRLNVYRDRAMTIVEQQRKFRFSEKKFRLHNLYLQRLKTILLYK